MPSRLGRRAISQKRSARDADRYHACADQWRPVNPVPIGHIAAPTASSTCSTPANPSARCQSTSPRSAATCCLRLGGNICSGRAGPDPSTCDAPSSTGSGRPFSDLQAATSVWPDRYRARTPAGFESGIAASRLGGEETVAVDHRGAASGRFVRLGSFLTGVISRIRYSSQFRRENSLQSSRRASVVWITKMRCPFSPSSTKCS
jgi:hypothetical protein